MSDENFSCTETRHHKWHFICTHENFPEPLTMQLEAHDNKNAVAFL